MGRLSEALMQDNLYFDGKTYNPQRDRQRLSGQLSQVYQIMSDYQWHSLKEIATRCSGSEAGVSARLRDLRKARFGGFIVKKRCIDNGLWEYCLALSS